MDYWFEIAIINTIFAIGNIYFGHFEEHTPKLRRLAKILLVSSLAVGVSALAGRTGFYVLLGFFAASFAIVHGWYLPKKGIHPITGEPKERYYQLRGWKFPQ